MALAPSANWLAAARAGSAEPVLLFEFQPTVAFDEKNFRGDWAAGVGPDGRALGDPASASGLEALHPTDELRLARREVVSPEEQTIQDPAARDKLRLTFERELRVSVNGRETSRTWISPLNLAQVVRFDTAFRLERLCLGLYNGHPGEDRADYRGTTTVSLLTDLRNPREVIREADRSRLREAVPGALAAAFRGAEVLASRKIDHSRDCLAPEQGGPVPGVDYERDAQGRYWRIIDFRGENVWLPGGGAPGAILLEFDSLDSLPALQLLGANSRAAYSRGDLYQYNAAAGVYFAPDACLSFRFLAGGYAAQGTGTWRFDLGSEPGPGACAELELRSCEPAGTAIAFEKSESADGARWGPWRPATDGARVERRHLRLRATLCSDPDRLATPRVYALRAACRESHRFLLASRPLGGCPNLVAEAPDYSAEGEPLSGEASATDTSRLVLIDAGGMVSRLFGRASLKNDRVRVWLGFDAPGFSDPSAVGAAAPGDWLPFKTVWIEDWEQSDGLVTVFGYDQQVRFKEAEAPTPDSPPELTEKIHYDRATPAAIRRDLLRRARIRPSALDPASFAALEAAFPWELRHVIDQPRPLQQVDRELGAHLLSFLVVDESGRWAARWADYSGAGARPGQRPLAPGRPSPAIGGRLGPGAGQRAFLSGPQAPAQCGRGALRRPREG